MKCLVCGKEFEAARSDARFCSGACRAKFNRTDKSTKRTDVTDNRTDNPLSVTNNPDKEVSVTPEPDKESKTSEFIPNWKRNGFKSAKAAMEYAIALTLKNVPSAVVSWQGKSFSRENFNEKDLNKLEPIFPA